MRVALDPQLGGRGGGGSGRGRAPPRERSGKRRRGCGLRGRLRDCLHDNDPPFLVLTTKSCLKAAGVGAAKRGEGTSWSMEQGGRG